MVEGGVTLSRGQANKPLCLSGRGVSKGEDNGEPHAQICLDPDVLHNLCTAGTDVAMFNGPAFRYHLVQYLIFLPLSYIINKSTLFPAK